MKILIIGLGSIAQKHIHVLREIDPKVEIYALRSSKPASEHERVVNLYDWEEVADHQFYFALISSPSSHHLADVKRISGLGIPMMVEKPLFISLEQIKAFEAEVPIGTLIYTACNFRFHPVVQFLKQFLVQNPLKINEASAYCGSYLPDWRPHQEYTEVYSAKEEMGGGVHLDLIHEPDYMVYLFGMPQEVTSKNRKVSNLSINSIDSSVSLFQYPDFQAQITLNYFRKDTKRTLEIVAENQTLIADFVKSEVMDVTKDRLLFKDEKPSIYTTYKKQMLYFLSCLENKVQPMNSAQEAIQILKCVL